MELDTVQAQVAAIFAARGQRHTEGRRRVVAVLYASDRPMCVEDVLAADPMLVQSSTYRDMKYFFDTGLVRPRYIVDGRVHYELAIAGTGRIQLHLVCEECGSIEATVATESVERHVRSVKRLVASDGFETDDLQLVLRGRCTSCGSGAH